MRRTQKKIAKRLVLAFALTASMPLNGCDGAQMMQLIQPLIDIHMQIVGAISSALSGDDDNGQDDGDVGEIADAGADATDATGDDAVTLPGAGGDEDGEGDGAAGDDPEGEADPSDVTGDAADDTNEGIQVADSGGDGGSDPITPADPVTPTEPAGTTGAAE